MQSGILGESKGKGVKSFASKEVHIYCGLFWACPSVTRELICPSSFPGGIWWFFLLWPKIKWAAFPFPPVPSIILPSPRTCQPQSEAQLPPPCGPLIKDHHCFPAHWSKVIVSTITSTSRPYWLTLNGSKQGESCFHRHLIALSPLLRWPLWGSQPQWQFQLNTEKQLIDFFFF